jgi:ribose transport system permease protein
MIRNEDLDSLAEKTASRLDWSPPGSSSNRLLPLAVFLIMFAIFSIFANNFFTVRAVLNLLVQTSTFAILSIGSAMVLIVGCIDFSLGAVIALSGTAVVVFAVLGLPIWIAMIAATILGGVIGLANGFLVAKLRLSSFVTTLAMAMVIYGILGWFGSLHAEPPPSTTARLAALSTLANVPVFRIFSHNANGAPIEVFPGISWIVIIMVIVAALSHLFLEKTRLGRYAFLVGSNPEASHFSGIKFIRVKILAFVLAGMLAGLVGVLLASRMGGTPGPAAGYEMIGIAAAMIGGASLSGGTGSVGKTVIGSFLLSTLAMGLTMMNTDQIYLPVFLNGLVLLGTVYLDQARNRK